MPDKVIILALVLIAALELASTLVTGEPSDHQRCYALVIIVALGAYAAHLRELQKLGLLNGEDGN